MPIAPILPLQGASCAASGSTPAERGWAGYNNCPDVIELDDGDFPVIGKLTFLGLSLDSGTELLVRLKEQGASVGDDETVVVVPRDCILAAAKQLVAEGQRSSRGPFLGRSRCRYSA
ncbi:hypothetical protein GCM10011579_008530 [Streptomyces albiflavescens]|uniref:Uncharacterized protein n=1 Tax=Streptomyces albiflavescens TaxID=1623582 RepID=A0A918CZA0_9ACTN|nr:hypothetical protein [Streptomyces albiflavescens]GGN52009.1 hypothetical protein GCM10011579_008530 [Streptomyces albiflavescens]